ncbi:MAG: glycerate kinase type-2 family protein [Promethearchaeota archaeon]
MFVKNTSQLLINDLNERNLKLRKIGLITLEKSLEAVKPKKLIEKTVRIKKNKLIIKNDIYDLKKYKKILILGGGKCTAEMAVSLENILKNSSDILYEGVINILEDLDISNMDSESNIKFIFASHPVPNKMGLKGTKTMMNLVENTDKKDLVIFLISGGGSALLPLPKQGITLKELQETNSLLLASGATIHEINTIRKHLSDFKGGNLAKKLYNSSGATLISLIISDVVGDNLDSIASGPTVADLTTFKEAVEILKKYEIFNKIPTSAKNHLEEGVLNDKLENPKINDACFNNVHNYLIGSVNSAAKEALSLLKKQNFNAVYFSNEVIGEAQDFGKKLYQIISQKIKEVNKKEKNNKIALIGTGELTVTIKGKGIGGRNQEMLLSFLDFIKEKSFNYNFLIIAANLDGIEGNSKAMGALIDNVVLNQIVKKKFGIKNYLENNDSNSFFKLIKSEIVTGPTGCNVNDLLIILIQK